MTTQLTHPRTRAAADPWLSDPGFRFALANSLLVATLLAASALSLDHLDSELAVLGVLGLSCLGVPLGLGLLTGLVSWAMFTGFVTDGLGQLTFGPADRQRLFLHLGCAVVAWLATRAVQEARRVDE